MVEATMVSMRMRTMLTLTLLFLATATAFVQFPNSVGNFCRSRSLCSPTASSSLLKVYTPEQEEDIQKQERSVSDEVLDSVLSKLAAPPATKEETASSPLPPPPKAEKKKDNSAMAFLRKMGKVGGTKDFTNAVGSDEGSGMAAPEKPNTLKKAKAAYKECTVTGIIDNMDQIFPLTSSGTAWRGVSDSVKGGFSNGLIRREVVEDKPANVLEGSVVLGDDGKGYLQMVTDLSLEPNGVVDASNYDGIEIDVLSREGFEFNVHLRSPSTDKSASNIRSYRHIVNLEVTFAWDTIRIPFSSFQDGDNTSVDPSSLERIGIVAADKEMDINLAVGGVRFYNVI